jgi:hypothetical protein
MIQKSYYMLVGNKDKAITTVNFYSTLEQAMTEQRKALVDALPEQCYVQVGRRLKDFAAAYSRTSNNDWIALNEAVWSNETIAGYKTQRLNINIPRGKQMAFKTGWGWVNAVVELFQQQLGVEFLNMKPTWKDHVVLAASNKDCYQVSYTCKIPKQSVDKIRRLYGCEVYDE